MFSGFASALQLTYLLGSLTTIQSYICQPPTAPLIVTPIDGTTVEAGEAFAVSGDGPFLSAIVISSEGTDLVSVQADDSNHFSAYVTLPTEGEKTISVKAERPCGTTQGNTVTVTVTPAIVDPTDPTGPTDPVDPTNPTNPSNPETPTENNPQTPSTNIPSTPTIEDPLPTSPPQPDTTSDDQGTSNGLFLSIHSPSDNSSTTDSSVFVNGSTNAPSTITVTVNGEQMARTFIPNKAFGLNIPLTVGVNTIVVAANGDEGAASVKLTVTRQAESEQTAWYKTEQGQMTIRIAAISLISILVVIVIIGIIIL